MFLNLPSQGPNVRHQILLREEVTDKRIRETTFLVRAAELEHNVKSAFSLAETFVVDHELLNTFVVNCREKLSQVRGLILLRSKGNLNLFLEHQIFFLQERNIVQNAFDIVECSVIGVLMFAHVPFD